MRLSFSTFSGFSPPKIKGSPHSFSRLFSLGRTGSFTFSTPSDTLADGPEPDLDSKLQIPYQGCQLDLPFAMGEGDNGDIEDKVQDSKMSLEGATQYREDVNKDSDSDSDDELLYEAESPDEAALVHAAHAYRCTLRARSADRLLVKLPGIGSLNVELLHILPFDSNRKRMSVVVRHPYSGQVVVYTKGADSVIMDLSEPPTGKFPSQTRDNNNTVVCITVSTCAVSRCSSRDLQSHQRKNSETFRQLCQRWTPHTLHC